MTDLLASIALFCSTASVCLSIIFLGKAHNKTHLEILKARREIFELQASLAILRIDVTEIKFNLKKEKKG